MVQFRSQQSASCNDWPCAAPADLCVAAQPLYSYLRGGNDRQLQIDMAKPAIIDIRPNKDFSSTGTNYTVLFYLPGLSEVCFLVAPVASSAVRTMGAGFENCYGPHAAPQEPTPPGGWIAGRAQALACGAGLTAKRRVQETSPKPTSKEVRVVTSPKQRFYVYGFGGFATGGSILNSALKLALALKTDKQSFQPDHLWSALYDAPTRLFGRHNEVMFSASDKDSARPLPA